MRPWSLVHILVLGVMILVLMGLLTAQGVSDQSFPIPLGLMRPYIPYANLLEPRKVNLGRLLFFDKRLSSDGRVSCGTCHNPAMAFTDNQRFSTAINGKFTTRNAPTILNAAFFDLLNWDGSSLSLELQARSALLNPKEMGMSEKSIISFLSSSHEYKDLFKEVFDEISLDKMVMAIAAYERTLLSGDSPFDRFMYTDDENAISILAKHGLEVFLNKGGCLVCHQIMHERLHPFGGRNAFFTDNRFHNLGVGMDKPSPDLGRYEITREPDDIGKFKTPILRNVALTAPYMHDGSLSTLEEVIDFYDKGGIPNSNLDPGIKPLNLSEHEKAALVEFLKSLTTSQLEFNGTKEILPKGDKRSGHEPN